MSLTRTRPVNPVRAALEQAMVSPRVQAAVTVFVNALIDEGEAVLRQRYGGETLRMYTPKRGGAGARDARDSRIAGALSSGDPPALIAEREAISLRRVQQIAKKAGLLAKSSA
jgi:hypothetical protein